MSGNEAIAEGAIRAGCRFYAGYPITPQNELIAYMAVHLPESGGVFVQAESEISAINMVYGASAAGVRAMTSSSSPGISLKQEGISYIAGAQLPAVIVNVMRGGPGLGNIACAQSDYFQATRGGGHGDYRCLVLAPSGPQEAFDYMALAFRLADQYRNPVMILADGMLGQMMEPVCVTTSPKHHVTRKGQKDQPWALTGCKGRSPRVVKSFFMQEGELEKFNVLLQKKYAQIQEKEQRYASAHLTDATTVLVAYGTMARIARGAMQRLREQGRKVGLLQPISLWPFPSKAIQKLMRDNPWVSFLVLEMSHGQMVDDVRLAVNGKRPVAFMGKAGGGMPTEEEIIKETNSL